MKKNATFMITFDQRHEKHPRRHCSLLDYYRSRELFLEPLKRSGLTSIFKLQFSLNILCVMLTKSLISIPYGVSITRIIDTPLLLVVPPLEMKEDLSKFFFTKKLNFILIIFT